MSAPLVELTRGPLVDAIHRGDLAVVSAEGRLLASAGNPVEKRAYWRSAAKPFQAMPVVDSGAAGQLGLTAADLALIAGSHNGEVTHVERASALMRRLGVSEADLACGVHPPLDPESASALQAACMEPTELHNNCSGNHLGMIAVALARGLDHRGYRTVDHPVQQEILRAVASFTGLPPSRIAVASDGCTVPCFGTSVYHMALAFARLMQPRPTVPERLAVAADRVREAMRSHPYLVAGRARFDTDLMRLDGRLVAKGGAGGVECVGFFDNSIALGLAVKIEDGAGVGSPARPAGFVLIHALRCLGIFDDAAIAKLRRYASPSLTNNLGEVVGEVRAVFELERRPGVVLTAGRP